MAPPSRPAQFERVLAKFLASVSQRVANVDLHEAFEEVAHERPSAKADVEGAGAALAAAFGSDLEAAVRELVAETDLVAHIAELDGLAQSSSAAPGDDLDGFDDFDAYDDDAAPDARLRSRRCEHQAALGARLRAQLDEALEANDRLKADLRATLDALTADPAALTGDPPSLAADPAAPS
ncbi:hypothetical protein M885DRAFT_624694 [Pelagophyceae sp. CCMP2097]|nr:hypothetical protein M885DRAFT_624694 [Pelagophyceae sp. CCMP2097]